LLAFAGGAPACGDESAGAPAPASQPAAPEPAAPLPPEQAFEAEGLAALRTGPRTAWPLESVHITSTFGWRTDPVTGQGRRLHRGLDLRASPGTLVLSIAAGRVSFCGHDALMGNLVVVDHGQGIESYYAHLSDVLVHEGLAVDRGSAIGLSGNSGRSQAPHLHLSLRSGGVPVDPLLLLRDPLHGAPALAGAAAEHR
jgi:murein DD-endopeptidase MepM/ murein hydrolase activator NlpD